MNIITPKIGRRSGFFFSLADGSGLRTVFVLVYPCSHNHSYFLLMLVANLNCAIARSDHAMSLYGHFLRTETEKDRQDRQRQTKKRQRHAHLNNYLTLMTLYIDFDDNHVIMRSVLQNIQQPYRFNPFSTVHLEYCLCI